jgi:hypothetical protein
LTAVGERVDSWLWPSAPAERLAVLRIAVGLFAFGYVLVRLPVFLALADADTSRFDPVGVLAWLPDPLPGAAVTVLVVVTVVLAAAYTIGLCFRITGPAFALAFLVLTTYRSSWGQLLWFEALIVLDVLIVGFSPSADALAFSQRRSAPAANPRYGGPVHLAAVVTVATYVVAGIAKLHIAGWAWMDGTTLQNHIAYSAARLDVLGGTPSPFAGWLVSYPALLTPVAIAAMLLELGAPVALIGGRVRTVWVAATWLLHVGIALTLFVVFPFPLYGVAFAPFFRLERVPAAIRARHRRHVVTEP